MPAPPERFRLGVNYWPSETAMDWLARYDAAVVRRDFTRIAAAGMDTIRIFLRWEDLQPSRAHHQLRPARRRHRHRRRSERGRGRADRDPLHRPHERRELATCLGHRWQTRATTASEWCPTAPCSHADRCCGAGTPMLRSPTPKHSWPTVSRPCSADIPPCGRGTSATRAPTARSRPTPTRRSDGSSG